MKVNINTTLDINTDAWAQEYGLDPADLSAIRTDVQDHVHSLFTETYGTGHLDVLNSTPTPPWRRK